MSEKQLTGRAFISLFVFKVQFLCVVCLLFTPVLARGMDPIERVVIKMGSWRTDDVRQMNAIIDIFHKENPGIRIIYDPTTPPEYDDVLNAQLEGGTGPDLFYLRSFNVSRKLYEKGYLAPLDNLPGIKKNFAPAMRAPWTSDNGVTYGVPFIAVSHGVYYNSDLYKKFNLTPPKTWEAFLENCRTLKAGGVTPLANASGDPWTINEIVFFNLAPNFIGGMEGRKQYLTGKRCFNDRHMIEALAAVKELKPFMPEDQALLTYMDSLQLFIQGKAAMWLGGSWDIPYFNAESPAFEWDIFAPPPPTGRPGFITFHLDAGMGINAGTRHKKAALTFLEWICRPGFGRILGNELPGFFPMHLNSPVLADVHANKFIFLNRTRQTDIRLVWEKLREGTPDGYDLMMDAAVSVLNGMKTPTQAANDIQSGLAKWFGPARNCQTKEDQR